MSSIERRAAKAYLAEPSVARTASKGLVVGGGAAIALSVLATLIPFVGVFGLGVVMVILGMLFFLMS